MSQKEKFIRNEKYILRLEAYLHKLGNSAIKITAVKDA